MVIRPIAVDCVLRSLTAKCAGNFALQRMPELLAPRQLGCGVIRGVEAAVHGTRTYLNNMQLNQAKSKVDFKNTFNSIHHDKNVTCC